MFCPPAVAAVFNNNFIICVVQRSSHPLQGQHHVFESRWAKNQDMFNSTHSQIKYCCLIRQGNYKGSLLMSEHACSIAIQTELGFPRKKNKPTACLFWVTRVSFLENCPLTICLFRTPLLFGEFGTLLKSIEYIVNIFAVQDE